MTEIKIYGWVDVDVISADPNTGKDFLKLTFKEGPTIYITTNLAEMIGGAGAGVRKRREDRESGH